MHQMYFYKDYGGIYYVKLQIVFLLTIIFPGVH
jgi:hypothetical protein